MTIFDGRGLAYVARQAIQEIGIDIARQIGDGRRVAINAKLIQSLASGGSDEGLAGALALGPLET